MSWKRCWRYLWCAQSSSWTRIRRKSSSGNSHVPRQGILARQRIIWYVIFWIMFLIHPCKLCSTLEFWRGKFFSLSFFTYGKWSHIDFSHQTSSVENSYYYDENYDLSNHSRFPPEILVYDGSDCLNLFIFLPNISSQKKD